jgi:hypothetical protein
VTKPGEVFDRFIASSPTLRRRLMDDDSFEVMNRGLPYVEAGWVASQVIVMQEAGDDSAIEAILAEAERLLAEHDRDMWGVVTVGFFESLQNLLGHRGLDASPLTRRLGVEGHLAWEWLNGLWAGECPDPPYGWKTEEIG